MAVDFDGKIRHLEERFDGLSSRIEGIEKRLEGLNTTVGEHSDRLDSVDTEVAELRCDDSETFEDRLTKIEKDLNDREYAESMKRGM